MSSAKKERQMTFSDGSGKALGITSPTWDQVKLQFARMNSDESRAGLAWRWLRIVGVELEQSWPLIYEIARIAKTQEVWKTPLRTGEQFTDFDSWFSHVMGGSFATFADLEETHHFAQATGVAVERVQYSEAREQMTRAQRAIELVATEPVRPTRSESVAAQPRNEQGQVQAKPVGDIITNGETLSRGTSASYLAARLKRDAPEIAAQLAEGAFKSVRAAAVAAGLVKPPSLVAQAFRLVERMTPAERSDFERQVRPLLGAAK